jgi:MFS family permease
MGSTASLEEIMLPALVDQTTKDPSDIGWIMAAYSLSTLISAMLYAAYHEHLSDHWLIKLCIVGVGLLFLGMVIFDSPFYIMIVAFISGFVFGPLGPIIDSQLLTETPKKFRVAMLAATYTLGIGIAPIMVILHAAIIDFYSIKLLCSLLTGVMIITLFIPTHQRST